MCGRFVAVSPPTRLVSFFGVDSSETFIEPGHQLEPNYNVAPSRDIFTIHEGTDYRRRLEPMRWGLIPHWAKDPGIGNRMINARSETVATKNAFRSAFRHRRCLIPADGFYEWKPVTGSKHKQPWYFQPAKDEILAFAGLWETWRPPPDTPEANIAGKDPVVNGNPVVNGDPVADDSVRSCTIITCDANEVVGPVHNRMPVILTPNTWALWLDPDIDDVSVLQHLMVPAKPNVLIAHLVSTAVNKPANNGPQLIEPANDANAVVAGYETEPESGAVALELDFDTN